MGLTHFRGFALFLAIAGLVLMVVVLVGRQTVDQQVRTRFLNVLQEQLGPLGLKVELEDAHFVPDRGFLFRGLTLLQADAPRLKIDRIMVRADASWQQLLLNKINPKLIEVAGAHLFVSRDTAGKWDIEPLVHQLSQRTAASRMNWVPTKLEDCLVEFRVKGAKQTAIYTLREIHLSATPRTDSATRSNHWDICGGLSASSMQQLAFNLDWNATQQSWSAAIAASAAHIDSNMLSAVTEFAGDPVPSKTDFKGVLDVQCSAAGTIRPPAIHAFQVDGELRECEISDPLVPSSIHQGQADFRLTQSAIDVWNISGTTEEGDFNFQFHRDGLFDGDWRLVGGCRHLSIDGRVINRLPPTWQRLYSKWTPSGLVDLQVDLTRRATSFYPVVQAAVIDASFEFERFPYRIEHCVGNVSIKGDLCQIDIRALDENRVVHITGNVRNPGKDFTGQIDIDVDGLIPVDAKLFRALAAQPKTADVVKRFSPTGNFRFKGRIERSNPANERPNLDYRIELVDCSVRHDCFDYPFYNVNGELRLTNDRVDVKQVAGVHGNGIVQCDGQWSKSDGLDLDFIARSVSLDDQLLAALPPKARARWSELRPQGIADVVQVKMRQATGTRQPSIKIEAQLFGGEAGHGIPVSVQPTWFNYPINNLAGRITIADGSLTLESIRGDHGPTWFSFNGQGNCDDDNWELRLKDLFIGGLEPDEQLLNALPASLAAAAKKVRLSGLLNVSGELSIHGQTSASTEIAATERLKTSSEGYVSWIGGERSLETIAQPTSGHPRLTPFPASLSASSATLTWNLRLDFDDMSALVGFPLDNVCGSARLQGQLVGDGLRCAGRWIWIAP